MYDPEIAMSPRTIWLVSDIVTKLTKFEAIGHPSLMLRRANRIKTVRSSLAIEGNTLTLEQVTDIVNGKRVLGSPREILEVKNALECYDSIGSVDITDMDDLLRMHGIMMRDLLDDAGGFRTSAVGVFAGRKLIHMGSPSEDVPTLVHDLLGRLATTDHHPLIASCVFHYELENIHPFSDGNGRMGRLWQTAILSSWSPDMAWVPVESVVRLHQQEYYDAIEESRSAGNPGPFIDFMLGAIDEALSSDTSDLLAPVPETSGLSRVEASVLEMIERGTFVNNAAAAEMLSVSERTVARAVKTLREGGFIERVGSDRNGRWRTVG